MSLVAVSDMQGLGTPGEHPYLVGRAQGMAVLDMARAAQRLAGAGVPRTGRVGIMGYSEGGSSAGWAAQLAASYAPDLDVRGSAVGGVPGDLRAISTGLDGGLFTALLVMAAAGYDTAYPELGLAGELTEPGTALVDRIRASCLTGPRGIQSFVELFGKRASDFTKRDLLADPAWQARLDENKLGQITPSAPVFQYQGRFDEVALYDQAAALRSRWCAGGADVTWRVYPVAERLVGAFQGNAPALDFLGARFAGEPTTGNCAAP